jgi:hypothetical protein
VDLGCEFPQGSAWAGAMSCYVFLSFAPSSKRHFRLFSLYQNQCFDWNRDLSFTCCGRSSNTKAGFVLLPPVHSIYRLWVCIRKGQSGTRVPTYVSPNLAVAGVAFVSVGSSLGHLEPAIFGWSQSVVSLAGDHDTSRPASSELSWQEFFLCVERGTRSPSSNVTA